MLKLRKNKKGFTLVELIVSIVILSIVLLAAFGFMVSGAKSYATVDTRINRQLKSQLTLGQITDCLMNCNAGINDIHVLIGKDVGNGSAAAHINCT